MLCSRRGLNFKMTARLGSAGSELWKLAPGSCMSHVLLWEPEASVWNKPEKQQHERISLHFKLLTCWKSAGGTHSCRHLTRHEGDPQQHTESNAYQNKRGRDAAEQRPRLMWHKKTQTETKADVDAQRRLRYTTNREHVLLWNLEISRNRPGNIKLKINDPQRNSHRLPE